jgi:hypothetical protein
MAPLEFLGDFGGSAVSGGNASFWPRGGRCSASITLWCSASAMQLVIPPERFGQVRLGGETGRGNPDVQYDRRPGHLQTRIVWGVPQSPPNFRENRLFPRASTCVCNVRRLQPVRLLTEGLSLTAVRFRPNSARGTPACAVLRVMGMALSVSKAASVYARGFLSPRALHDVVPNLGGRLVLAAEACG